LKTRPTVFLGLALLLAAGCGMPAFQDFSPEGGKFQIKMPGTPKEETRDTRNGKLHLYTAEFTHGAYSVQWIDLPAAAQEDEKQLRRRLDAERDAGVKEVNGKLVTDTEVKLDDKYPGRDFTAVVDTAKYPKDGQIHCRLYLVNGRLYQLLAVGTKAFLEQADTARFFDSFRLQS
jgi:hypothetical protein